MDLELLAFSAPQFFLIWTQVPLVPAGAIRARSNRRTMAENHRQTLLRIRALGLEPPNASLLMRFPGRVLQHVPLEPVGSFNSRPHGDRSENVEKPRGATPNLERQEM